MTKASKGFLTKIMAARPARAIMTATLIATSLAAAYPASAGFFDRKSNQFETGFIVGGTSTRATNPSVLGPKGLTKRNASSHNARTARIAFERIKGGLDYHQAAVNHFVRQMTKRNNVKVVGLDQNPTHIIKGRILALETSSGAIVSYRWKIHSPSGKKLQYFVDTERGTRVRLDTPWRGISELEIRKVTKTSADRLVYWLNNGTT